MPQHFLQDEVLDGLDRAGQARPRSAASTSRCTPTSTTPARSRPLVGKAAKKLLEMGFRDVRNQGVLLRGVNDTAQELLELCFMLLDHARSCRTTSTCAT